MATLTFMLVIMSRLSQLTTIVATYSDQEKAINALWECETYKRVLAPGYYYALLTRVIDSDVPINPPNVKELDYLANKGPLSDEDRVRLTEALAGTNRLKLNKWQLRNYQAALEQNDYAPLGWE
jgi:hypothetical protein